jgi:hypothetical protein
VAEATRVHNAAWALTRSSAERGKSNTSSPSAWVLTCSWQRHHGGTATCERFSATALRVSVPGQRRLALMSGSTSTVYRPRRRTEARSKSIQGEAISVPATSRYKAFPANRFSPRSKRVDGPTLRIGYWFRIQLAARRSHNGGMLPMPNHDLTRRSQPRFEHTVVGQRMRARMPVAQELQYHRKTMHPKAKGHKAA